MFLYLKNCAAPSSIPICDSSLLHLIFRSTNKVQRTLHDERGGWQRLTCNTVNGGKPSNKFSFIVRNTKMITANTHSNTQPIRMKPFAQICCWRKSSRRVRNTRKYSFVQIRTFKTCAEDFLRRRRRRRRLLLHRFNKLPSVMPKWRPIAEKSRGFALSVRFNTRCHCMGDFFRIHIRRRMKPSSLSTSHFSTSELNI